MQREDVNGRRFYVTPLGRLPSVTTVLKATLPARDREGLARWRRSVGETAAEEVTRSATIRGGALHSAIERYLETGEEGSGPWWDSVYHACVRHLDRARPYSYEQSVVSPSGFAGAYDCLAWCPASLGTTDPAGDDTLETLFDWKTARKRKRREWVRDYLLQAAAYAGAVNQARAKDGAPLIKRALVVVAYEDREADIFPLELADLRECWSMFMQRLAEYQLRYGKASKPSVGV